MNEDFKREIRYIAEKAAGGVGQARSSACSNRELDRPYLEALDEFYEISVEGVRTFNECVKQERLAVHRLPADFLELFLGIAGRRAGLYIVSPQKLAVFFDEDPDIITVIGKIRSNSSNIQTNVNKTLQLIKISFTVGEKGYIYKESTGNTLEPEGVIALIIRWLVST